MTATAGDVVTVRFVGRSRELSVVSAAMEAARSGHPQILWVEGDPGIGKTAFVRRCLASADDMVVIDSSGDESETTLEYGIVTQLLTVGQARTGEARPPGRVGESSPATAFSAGADLLEMLGTLQESSPVLITVDDAHWMDLPSAGALLFALRRLHGDRVLVLMASRTRGLEHLGSSWSRLLDDAGRVQRVGLTGLTGSEVCQLADSLGVGPLTLAAGERLREHTDGHPLYIKALLGEITADTLNFHPGPLPAPRSFAATVLAGLADLGGDAQELVAAAAVAGVRCQLAMAGSVAGLGDPLAAFEEALASGLLALVPGVLPEAITFPHPLLRAAVRDDLSATRRRALHLAWAQRTTGADALAHRAGASHGSDDVLAGELQVMAEQEITEGHLSAGIERLLWSSQLARTPDKRELALLRAVECLLLAGDVPSANSRRQEVLGCVDSPRRSFIIGALTASVGLLSEAEATFREVVARSDFGLHPELEGPVASSLAIVYAFMSRGPEAIQWAGRATAAPRSSPTVEVTARQARVLGLMMSGRGDEAIAELAPLSPSRIVPEPFEAELLATRGNLKTWWGDLIGATKDLEAVIKWSRAGASLRSLPNAYSGLAEAEYRLGRWDGALAHAEVAVSLGEDTDRAWDLPFVHAVAAHLHAGRGSWEAAGEHVQAARSAARMTPLPLCIYYACEAAANLAWMRTDWEQVLGALEPLYQRPGGGAVAGMGQRLPALMRVEALISTGRLADARAGLAELDAAPSADPGDVTRLEYWRLRADLERALERPDRAQEAFARATQVAATVESPLYESLLGLTHGRFLRQAGSRRAAIGTLRAARAHLELLGAGPLVSRCDAELAACGVRLGRSGDDDRYGLTAREDVVARLVASGKSNREVAEQLYLSTKAIEYHLSNVFAKVNVRSRHDLAARLSAGEQPPG